MIRDAYYEESSACNRGGKEAKVYTACTVIGIIFFVVAAIQLYFAFTAVATSIALFRLPADDPDKIEGVQLAYSILSWLLLTVAPLCVGVALFFFRRKFNVSYDYVFVEDELRISKIFNGKKRKYLKTFKCDQILKMGRCDKESFERTCAGLSKKQIVFLTSNRQPSEKKDFYYILYSSSIEKTVNIIEAKVELIDYLVRAAGRNKWEAQ